MATPVLPNETIEIKKTGKRDYLTALETKAQSLWFSQKLFDTEAPPLPKGETYESFISSSTPTTFKELQAQNPKWMGTSPYPYMNGTLHLGHAFTVSKIEFAAGFERMLGKRVLMPMGFHVTGMPIKTAADKIAREIELFGPDFEGYVEPVEEEESESTPIPAATATPASKSISSDPSKSKKGKLANKSTGLTYQFQIMQLVGVPKEEIKKFAEPRYWVKYFPPITVDDCRAIGARYDWRRTFVTTDINPYYDSFVRWQMNKLHAQGRIKFGERYTIFSPKDDQPCMDHDRASGEAVGPQEYTALKLEVLDWSESGVSEEFKEKLKGKKVSMVAATLRPETMYGQTNCFVGVGITYGVYEASETEAYLLTERAARNMAYQGIFAGKRGEYKKLVDVVGKDLVGTKVSPPFGILKEVYVLPMDGVKATKGTAVVTSVPSDSPDDYAALMDLRKKGEFYGVKPEWTRHDPIAVLSTPKYGDMAAPALVKEFKINSQKDIAQLAEAKDITYKEGFNNGTMIIGEFKGIPVSEAKPKVRAQMIEAGVAFAYSEPENQVISRSNDECVVALCDQWYLDYGVEDWKAIAKTLLERMNTFFPETKNQFEAVLDWLHQWACAKSYGLGTKLPWDPQFLVESLSDSTIYMSYYTVAYLLQGGDMYGGAPGPSGITPEQLTDEAWDYILGDGPAPPSSVVSTEKLAELKYNFNYFYPMDVRSSGKDLIPNHLTFCIYVHAALFKEDHWPKAMRANGHLLLNGKKMSKSTGNFLTMSEAVKKFGADATRLTLADSGDDINDANFEELTANAAILRLHTACEWATEMKEAKAAGTLRTGPLNAFDKAFNNEMNALIERTKASFEATFYKDALKSGFYEFQAARDWYREVTMPENGGKGMHADLIFRWIRVSALMAQPFVPHYCEFLWMDILGEKESIQLALWPEIDSKIDESLIAQQVYMRGVLSTMRGAEAQIAKKKGKGKAIAGAFDPSKAKSGRVYVSTTFPKWQTDVVESVRSVWEAQGSTGEIDDKKVRPLLEAQGLGKDKKAMPFLQQFKRKLAILGPAAFERALPFSELDTLNLLSPYIKSSMKFTEFEAVTVEEAVAKIEKGETGSGWEQDKTVGVEPGTPSLLFWNV